MLTCALWGANRRALGAPISSSDGQATIYNREDALADTATGSLQALGSDTDSPRMAYIGGASLSLRGDAAAAPHHRLQLSAAGGARPATNTRLQLYYSSDEGKTWHLLPTELDTNENLATAPADDSGLYMLASSIDIPFTQPDGICSPIRSQRHVRSGKRWHPSRGTTTPFSPTITAIRLTRGKSSMHA